MENTIPENWLEIKPSILSLSCYIKSLNTINNFYNYWIKYGQPKVYSLKNFMNPKILINSFLQNVSRAHEIPMECLYNDYKFITDENEIEIGNFYIDGLYIKNAKYNNKTNKINEIMENEYIFQKFPVIQVIPTLINANNGKQNSKTIECPFYKIPTGFIKTRRKDNLIDCILIEIPSNESKIKWIKRNISLVCEISDE